MFDTVGRLFEALFNSYRLGSISTTIRATIEGMLTGNITYFIQGYTKDSFAYKEIVQIVDSHTQEVSIRNESTEFRFIRL